MHSDFVRRYCHWTPQSFMADRSSFTRNKRHLHVKILFDALSSYGKTRKICPANLFFRHVPTTLPPFGAHERCVSFRLAACASSVCGGKASELNFLALRCCRALGESIYEVRLFSTIYYFHHLMASIFHYLMASISPASLFQCGLRKVQTENLS